VGGLAPDVVHAFGEATREALNNVHKHAGTNTAWMTVTGGDAVQVRVVDRGCGFEPGAVRPGLGLAGSIRDRMCDVGGAARVTSEPGEGTCVELAWPA
jgi:signal transduction histidine kinase